MFLPILMFLSLSAFSSTQNLKIKISEMTTNKGNVLFILFKDGVGFPDGPSQSIRQGKVSVAEARAGFILSDLEPGEYALSVIHDENSNNKLDTNFLGIPKEGFGFSKNPTITFGAPSFGECQFSLQDNKQIEIRLKHF
jgi:uncharacterized protein (DUF2141 family)